ncbi:MAG: hypothetical protein GX558_07040, partial [Clostridiales bacterium]|nr:hypothetical protein [Clostridiales bacterium]
LRYLSLIAGYPAETIVNVSAVELRDTRFNPHRRQMESSQAHWVAVLRGECEQVDTPNIALQTMLVSEGIFLSHQLGREVCADEIPELSQSMAIRRQETPFGELEYRTYPFF